MSVRRSKAVPARELRRLIRTDEWDRLVPLLDRSRSPDGLVARQIVLAQEHCKIYLLSKLSPETVEGLRMIDVPHVDQLERLIEREDEAVVFHDAQYAIPKVMTSA